MKIAVTGKGGVGKTTIVALLARILRDSGKSVIVFDADPDMNLCGVLGVPVEINPTPIIELKELIAERTGTEVGKSAPIFKMNPKVNDIPETYWLDHQGVKIMVMGTIKGGGAGCACPENAFLKTLMGHMLIGRNEWIILDMEAGIEHLGRGTAAGVDHMLVVVEPNQSSLDTALRINRLAGDIRIKKVSVICNKINDDSEMDYIRQNLGGMPVMGRLNFTGGMRRINLRQESALSFNGEALEALKKVANEAGWLSAG